MGRGDEPLSPVSQFNSDSDNADDVVSLTPSITDYPVRWGRRYHKYKEGKYLFPNDEQEAQRLDFQHSVIKRLHGGKLFFAPIKEPHKILDIGTGTGIWPIELADSGLVPGAKITGTDLSPIQPEEVPESVTFEIADWTEPDWCRKLNTIDLIHIRMMVNSLGSFPRLMKTAQKYLKAGSGWLEFHELDPRLRSDDNSIPENWPLDTWEKKMARGVRNIAPSLSLHTAPKLKKWMEECGFVDVKEVIYKLPIGSWSKDQALKHIGLDWSEVIYDGLPGLSYKILGQEGLEMNRTEIEVHLSDVRKCLSDNGVHAYMNFHTVYGRKPERGSTDKRG